MVSANDDVRVRARACGLSGCVYMYLLAFFLSLHFFLFFSPVFLKSLFAVVESVYICSLALLSLSTSCLVSCAMTVVAAVPSALSTFACNVI